MQNKVVTLSRFIHPHELIHDLEIKLELKNM